MGCRIVRDEQGQTTAIICSRGQASPKCEVCGGYNATRLCDYPVSQGKTCDRRMCPNCSARPKGKDEDYCPDHRERAGLGKPEPKFDLEGARFISARYDGRCKACRVETVAGDQVFYMPREKGVLCEPCAAEMARAMTDERDKEGDIVEVVCDCGDEHEALVLGEEGQLVEWTCPKDGELKRSPNV